MTSETIKINLIPGGDLPVLHSSQFDEGRALTFEVYDGEELFTSFNAYDISLHVRKVDGTIIGIDTYNVDSENHQVIFFTTEQLTACAGKNIGELVFTDPVSGSVVGSCNFWLEVEGDPYSGGIDSVSEIENLSTQIASIVDGQLDNYYTKQEVDEQIETIVEQQVTPIVSGIVAEQVPPIVASEMTNYYTKSETDSAFYNKSEVDTLLSGKADTSDLPDMSNYYDKTTTDTLLASKANTSTTYTKTEVDNLIANIPATDITTDLKIPASVQSFSDGGDNIPLKSCLCEIPVDGDGISSVKIYVSSKNLIFTLHQASSTQILINAVSSYSAVLRKGTYTFSATISETCSFNYRKSSGDTTVNIKSFTNTGDVSATFTISEDMFSCNFFLYNSQGVSISDISNAQLELNDEASTYEAHKGQVYTVSLGETLTQGGTLEAVSGLLTRTDTTTSQLTGVNIDTLSGLNYIYSDVGDIQSLEYFNDNADDIAAMISLMTRS